MIIKGPQNMMALLLEDSVGVSSAQPKTSTFMKLMAFLVVVFNYHVYLKIVFMMNLNYYFQYWELLLSVPDPYGFQQLDAVRSALNALGGFKDVEIMVAETGWAYRGDSNEVGTSVENARAYNGNLIAHLRSMVGTPLMPGKSVDTYIFALYDENLKPGPTSERAFGLFYPNLTMTYDVGLSKNSQVRIFML